MPYAYNDNFEKINKHTARTAQQLEQIFNLLQAQQDGQQKFEIPYREQLEESGGFVKITDHIVAQIIYEYGVFFTMHMFDFSQQTMTTTSKIGHALAVDTQKFSNMPTTAIKNAQNVLKK